MEKSLMLKWANEVIKKSGFKNPKGVYWALENKGNVRNIIYFGTYKKIPAVLKIYDESRRLLEPSSLKYFNKVNKSKLLVAPKLYKYKEVSPSRGWYIMERLQGGYFISNDRKPIDQNKRKEFLKVYFEYRKNFPKKPFRPLLIAEKLPADEFHIIRVHRWFEMAEETEIELELQGKTPVLNTKKFFPLYFKAQELIKQEFRNRKLVWSHGHFKPKEIYYSPSKKIYYLTDFAHTYFYPEGYELGFIIWSDWLLADNWKLPYSKWVEGINNWIKDLLPIAKKLNYERPEELIKASLVERLLGTILADVTASSKPRQEKVARLKLLLKLLEDLIKRNKPSETVRRRNSQEG